MSKALYWAVTTICLWGTVLNVMKRRSCFVLWIVGNIAWTIFDFLSGLYSRMTLDIVQLGFAVWGLIAWSRNWEK